MKFDKRGIIGSFISMFIATVIIVVVLGIFVAGSSVVKISASVKERVVVDKEGVGVTNDMKIYGAMFERNNFLRVAISEGKNLAQVESEMKVFRVRVIPNRGTAFWLDYSVSEGWRYGYDGVTDMKSVSYNPGIFASNRIYTENEVLFSQLTELNFLDGINLVSNVNGFSVEGAN